MLRGEAEQEAERRNREDPQRDRYEFYAFDESAGLAADAWDVGARLRRGPIDLHARETPARRERRTHERPALASEELALAPGEPAPAADEPTALVDEASAAWDEPAPPRSESGRPGLFVRGLGATVVVVGALWIATVAALAAFLRPEGVVGLGVYVAAGGLGLLAILLGVAIRRS